MYKQDEPLSDYLHTFIPPVSTVDDSRFLTIMDRVQRTKNRMRKQQRVWRFAVPVLMVFVFSVSFIFPVFGSERGSLLDVYHTYRVNRSLSALRDTPGKSFQDPSVSNFLFSSLLEDQYKIDPSELLEVQYVYNIPPKDGAFLLLLAQKTGISVQDLVQMRKVQMDWGVMAKHLDVSPNQLIHSLQTLRFQYAQTPINGFRVSGRITHVNRNENCFFIERFPYPIYMNQNLEIMPKIQIDDPVLARVYFDPTIEHYVSETLHIQPLKPNRPVSFIGYIISMQNDSLVLGAKDGRRIILHIPPHFSEVLHGDEELKAGQLIRIDTFPDRNGENHVINYRLLSDQILSPNISTRSEINQKTITPTPFGQQRVPGHKTMIQESSTQTANSPQQVQSVPKTEDQKPPIRPPQKNTPPNRTPPSGKRGPK